MHRYPVPEELSADQQAFLDHIVSERGGIAGPYIPLLRIPSVALRVMSLGIHFREIDDLLDPQLREIAILVTVVHWRASFAIRAHRRLAAEVGLDPTIVDALCAGSAPTGLDATRSAVHRFSAELVVRGTISTDLHDELAAHVGPAAVIGLTTVIGYYCLIAMVLNLDSPPDV